MHAQKRGLARSAVYGLAALALLTVGAGRGDATLVVYTTRASWEAALGRPFTLEDFNDNTANGFTLALLGPGHTAPGISGGRLQDRLDGTGTTTFTFPTAMIAFGGEWDLAGPGGVGTGIRLFADGVEAPSQIPDTSAGGFFGVISDTPFSVIELREGTQGGAAETYDLDNVVFASADVAAVPAPPTVLLAAVGALGMLATKLRRRKA